MTSQATPRGDARRFLTTRELAAYLNVPVSTVYFWRANGIGPRAFKLPKGVRYRIDDVEAWLLQRADDR